MAIPVLAGVVIYLLKYVASLPQVIQNYFADALWAYGFSSIILIIWNRKLNILWMIIAFLSAFSFELLQYGRYIDGTGDYQDIIVYGIFFGLAICLNKYFKKPQFVSNKSHE